MNVRYWVELSEAERVELQGLLSGKRQPVRRVKRAQILLASDLGQSEEAIARAVGVGISTVYRTLKLLVESKLAEEHHFAGGVTLYEPVLNHHEHMICLDCQLIIEFENEELEALKERIAQDHGFKMIRHSLHLYGLCRACQEVPSRALVHV